MTPNTESIVRELLARHGRLYAEDAGIRLADRPGPLYQLLVLATLLSAPITAETAAATAVSAVMGALSSVASTSSR